MNPVDILKEQIQSTIDSAKPGALKRHVCCAECLAGVELEGTMLPPAKCPACGKEDPKWGSGVSKEAAEARALLLQGQSTAQTAGQQPPDSSEQDETSSSEDASTKSGEQPGSASGATTVSTGSAPKKSRSSRKKETPATPLPSAITPPSDPGSSLETDWSERRRQAVAALIEKYKLNKLEPVEVGSATVSTFGYTVWQDGLPIFCFMEPTDTAKSFKDQFMADKTDYPGIEIDVVRCHSMDNDDVVACCFKGNLVASTNSGRGNVRVTAGAKVRIGALATDKSVRFVVLY